MKARIEWLGTEVHKQAIVAGGRYTTVVRFADESAEDWKRDAWSLDLTGFVLESDGTMIASVKYLSSEAPIGRLVSGATFELDEGPKCSARGVILGN
jgi:hypothetical protein